MAMKYGTYTKVVILVLSSLLTVLTLFQVLRDPEVKSPQTVVPQVQVEEPMQVHSPMTRIPRASEPKPVGHPAGSSQDSAAFLGNWEASAQNSEMIPGENASVTRVLEAESNGAIAPELATLFAIVRDWRDRNRALSQEADSFMDAYSALGRREQVLVWAIGGTSGEENRKLHVELEEVQSRKQELADVIDPLGKERDRITRELELYLQTNHGMTLQEFFDTHGTLFDAWRAEQTGKGVR